MDGQRGRQTWQRQQSPSAFLRTVLKTIQCVTVCFEEFLFSQVVKKIPCSMKYEIIILLTNPTCRRCPEALDISYNSTPLFVRYRDYTRWRWLWWWWWTTTMTKESALRAFEAYAKVFILILCLELQSTLKLCPSYRSIVEVMNCKQCLCA
jgi:hypothetical protein